MNRRFFISFLLLVLLGVQASVPCCLMGAATESNRSEENQTCISIRCRCCRGETEQSSEAPMPDGESQEPTCPFCTGTADARLSSSASKDLQDLRQISVLTVPVDLNVPLVISTDVLRHGDVDSLTAGLDPVKRLLL